MIRSTLFTAAAFLLSATVAHAADVDGFKRDAWSWLDSQTQVLETANQNIWSYAEIGLAENKSSKELQDLLIDNGFSVESGVAGMPTAFVATYGDSGPVIGILAEFDALPGVSQAASPVPTLGPNPEAGHACGHSVFGVGSTGAALAIKELIAAGAFEGTIKLYGTPAEETGIGKVYMLRAGYFKDDDVILNWHPSDRNRASYGNTKAIANVKFKFRGSAAHASAMPWSGRSALDGVELMSAGVNYMREHIKPDARIHYVITKGGGQPNVVPPEAEVWYYIRADTFEDVTGYFEWIKEIAEAAAKMSRTELEAVEIQSEIHEMITVRALSEQTYKNLSTIGAPRWEEQELAFARTTQLEFQDPFGRAIGDDDTPALHTTIQPLADEPTPARASTDVGDISWFVPIGGLGVASYGYGLPTHSWPVVAATGTTIGTKALVTAAKTITATAIDLYTDPAFMERVKADWRKSRGDAPFKTLIPEGQAAPSAVR
ncbi:MAG: amidohydrolase [Alphaproteobacteria bacterium]|nr:amidohydrolase [Alphaproteobacteria bacterium]